MTRTAGRPRQSQDERSEQTRARLVEAAIKVMVERGYAGFRVAEVASTAGVSRGGQLHHFPTKDSLVMAALEHVYTAVLVKTRERANTPLDAHAVIPAIIRDAMDFFFTDYFFIALDIMMAGGKDNRLLAAVAHISADQRIPAEQAWTDRLCAIGLEEQAARDILWLVWSVVRGLAIRRIIGDDPQREGRVIALVTTLVEAHIQTLC